MIRFRLLWLFPAALLISLINTKANEPYSVDSAIEQMCPYIEKTPLGVYMQNQESPKQFGHLARDLLSRGASHAPGFLLSYYHGSLVLPLLVMPFLDAGISVDNYLKPENAPPRSAIYGFMVDFISSAVAAATTSGWHAGLMFPAFLVWKYLTRTATINTADIAYYQNRIAFKNFQASSLLSNITKYNGRLRICTDSNAVSDSVSGLLVKFVSGHKQNDVALMTYVYPHLDPCRNIDSEDERGRRKCQHFQKVRNLYATVRPHNVKPRFKFSHRLTREVAYSLVNEKLGIHMTLLRSQGNLDNITFGEDILIPEEGWRVIEFNGSDDYDEELNVTNDSFQYFVTVAGNNKFYVFLGVEIEPVINDYGVLASTLVYLSPFVSISQHPLVAALPIEFSSRGDVLSFAEELVAVFGDSRQKVLLFKTESFE